MCPQGFWKSSQYSSLTRASFSASVRGRTVHQQPRDAAGVKGEEGLLVGGGHGQVGMHAVEHVLQVGGEHLHQPPLQLFPPSAGQKVLQRLAVFRRVVHKEPQRLAGILGAQAFLHQVLGALAGPPVHHVQHILKMVVKGLAADAAQRHQLLDGDLFEVLFLQQPEQCLGDLPLHICAHGFLPSLSVFGYCSTKFLLRQNKNALLFCTAERFFVCGSFRSGAGTTRPPPARRHSAVPRR